MSLASDHEEYNAITDINKEIFFVINMMNFLKKERLHTRSWLHGKERTRCGAKDNTLVLVGGVSKHPLG